MAFCGNCGKKLRKGEKTCSKCRSAAKKKGSAQKTANRRTNSGTSGTRRSKGTISPHKATLGNLNANVAAMVVYLATILIQFIPYVHYVAWILPLVLFFMEKKSKFVKYSCVTVFILSIISVVIYIVFKILIEAAAPRGVDGFVSLIMNGGRTGTMSLLFTLQAILNIAVVAVYVFCAVMSYFYKQVRLPGIDLVAEKLSNRK